MWEMIILNEKKYVLKNEEELVIRKANSSDALRVIEYVKKVANESDYLTFSSEEFNMTVDEEKEYIKNINQRNNCLFLIAEVSGKIVGNLNFNGNDRLRISHMGEFGISVVKEYWGKGVGSKLLKYLIEWSKKTKIIKKINLVVREDNQRAIELYKRFGFEKEGIITRYFYLNNKFYNAMQMGLKL